MVCCYKVELEDAVTSQLSQICTRGILQDRPHGARKRDFRGVPQGGKASEEGREGGFGLLERDTRTGIMWAEQRNEYLLPESPL